MIGALTVLSVALVGYAAGHYLCALLALGRARPEAPPPPPAAVTVLVPARDEGPAALHALRSILAQDHRGPVEARLLLADADDTSFALVREAFGLGEDLAAD